ncbi:MAG: hypothetical protein JWO51_1166 [Rhodospirillales bacterium]|nr:hypothetical protein [Rhodospirillales bacterium]
MDTRKPLKAVSFQGLTGPGEGRHFASLAKPTIVASTHASTVLPADRVIRNRAGRLASDGVSGGRAPAGNNPLFAFLATLDRGEPCHGRTEDERRTEQKRLHNQGLARVA